MLTTRSMTVTFDKSVAPSLLEGGYSYSPAGNNTITVDFDPIVEQNGTFKQLDIYDILEREGLDHLADSIIYTNYYEVN